MSLFVEIGQIITDKSSKKYEVMDKRFKGSLSLVKEILCKRLSDGHTMWVYLETIEECCVFEDDG